MLRTTLIKYISKEIWSIFLTCLLVFIFIILAARMLNLIDLMVNYGVGLKVLLSVIICQIPRAILYAMPVSCLMAVLLSFIRMSSDNEIIALHSSGISLFQLLSPVVIFSIICFLFTGFLTLFWYPYGIRTYESVLAKMVNSAESQIKEGELIDKENYAYYVSSYSPKDREMKDVFFVIKKKGEEKTIIAKKARFKSIKDKLSIEFTDYKVFTEGKAGETRIARSEGPSDIPVPIDKILETSDNKTEPMGMYFKELSELIKNSKEDIKIKNIAKLTLYEMISIPVAVFLIGITGAPLGAQIRAHGRIKGIIISLLLILSYYTVLSSVRIMCESGKVNPAIGVWLPVIYLFFISVFLLIRAARDLSLGILDRLLLSDTP